MNKEFQTAKFSDIGAKRASEIALAFDTCLNRIAEICPSGREMSLARTKMEEASFFAKKALISDLVNCEIQ